MRREGAAPLPPGRSAGQPPKMQTHRKTKSAAAAVPCCLGAADPRRQHPWCLGSGGLQLERPGARQGFRRRRSKHKAQGNFFCAHQNHGHGFLCGIHSPLPPLSFARLQTTSAERCSSAFAAQAAAVQPSPTASSHSVPPAHSPYRAMWALCAGPWQQHRLHPFPPSTELSKLKNIHLLRSAGSVRILSAMLASCDCLNLVISIYLLS